MLPSFLQLIFAVSLLIVDSCQPQSEKTSAIPARTPDTVSVATNQQPVVQRPTHHYGAYVLKQSNGNFTCEKGTKLLYLNPYSRTYYMVQYERNEIKDKKPLLYKSFMPFEGVENDPSQYQGQLY